MVVIIGTLYSLITSEKTFKHTNESYYFGRRSPSTPTAKRDLPSNSFGCNKSLRPISHVTSLAMNICCLFFNNRKIVCVNDTNIKTFGLNIFDDLCDDTFK